MKIKLGNIGKSVIWDIIAEQYGLPLIQGSLAYLMNRDVIDSVFNEQSFIDQANKVLSMFNAQPIQSVEDLDKLPDELKDVKTELKDYYQSLQKIKEQPIYKRGLLFQSGQLGTLAPENLAKNLVKTTKKKQALKQVAPKLNLPVEFIDVLNEDPNLALLLLASMMGANK